MPAVQLLANPSTSHAPAALPKHADRAGRPSVSGAELVQHVFESKGSKSESRKCVPLSLRFELSNGLCRNGQRQYLEFGI